MNASELRQKETVALHQELIDRLREQFNLRMQKGTGQSPRPHLIKAARRDIARIKTILNERGAKGSGS
jgi:large subunit ribosomal protein L29